jgi:N-acetyltransferase
MTGVLAVLVLTGALVRLEELTETHVDGLVAAAAEDRTTYGYTRVPHGRAAMVSYLHALLAARASGEAVPFAQISLSDDRIVGVTRFLNFRTRAGDG